MNIYFKEDKLGKERISVWSKDSYEVADIKHEQDQAFSI